MAARWERWVKLPPATLLFFNTERQAGDDVTTAASLTRSTNYAIK